MRWPVDADRPWALQARWIFPVASPPIPGGMVTIDGERIVAVGENLSGRPPFDLGNAAVLPGLCNAHTHLEFSNLRSPLGEPGMALPDWIRRVIAWRRECPQEQRTAIAEGLRESARCGVTTLGDIAQPGLGGGEADAESRTATPDTQVDVTAFLELIGLKSERSPALLEAGRQHVDQARVLGGTGAGQNIRAGLSPHAPYSVHPSLIQQTAEISRTTRVPLTMHLAESREELELLASHTGPFMQLLQDLDAWEPSAIPPGTRPLDYLRLLSQAHRSLVIHGNYLDDEEIAFIANHHDRMSVVYCPRTHAYFEHGPYPLARLLNAGIAVALGTDSRASNPDLDLLAELRWVAEHYPSVTPETVLRLGTIHGARALGRDNEVGSLLPGYLANLLVLALPDQLAADPHRLLFDSNLRAISTVFRGHT